MFTTTVVVLSRRYSDYSKFVVKVNCSDEIILYDNFTKQLNSKIRF